MIIEILRYLSINPLFGSGFLGVWIMFADLSGASHNQLLDVLFRTGVIGFSAFLFILYKLFQYNFRIKNNAIIVSMVGILIIGLFHETFKLSQGAFIFSFLIAQAFSDSGAERSQAKEATVA
jgi:O-antigen ligase